MASLRQVTLGIGPISDVTGFSHRDALSYTQILELLRRKLNEVIAWTANMEAFVRAISMESLANWNRDFEEFTQGMEVKRDEYNQLIANINGLIAESNEVLDQIKNFATVDTNYVALLT